MAAKSRYADEQILAAIASKRASFAEFMDKIADENDDWRFYIQIGHLLRVIYEHHLNGKFITKSQACRFIPVGHTNTCLRYVEEAEARGFIRFVADKNDARRLRVIPTDDLISYVRAEAERALDEARELIATATKHKPLPKDNHPLAEFRNV